MKTKTTLNETVREALGIALLQIMESKPFCEITIREIAAVAGVSRSSFYRNFTSKEELLSSHLSALYRSFFSDSEIPRYVTDPVQKREFLIPRFRFIREHSNIYRILYRHNLLYYFFQQTERELIPLVCGQEEDISPYHRAMLSGACAGIIRCWVERDFREDEETLASWFTDPVQYMCDAKGMQGLV